MVVAVGAATPIDRLPGGKRERRCVRAHTAQSSQSSALCLCTVASGGGRALLLVRLILTDRNLAPKRSPGHGRAESCRRSSYRPNIRGLQGLSCRAQDILQGALAILDPPGHAGKTL